MRDLTPLDNFMYEFWKALGLEPITVKFLQWLTPRIDAASKHFTPRGLRIICILSYILAALLGIYTAQLVLIK